MPNTTSTWIPACLLALGACATEIPEQFVAGPTVEVASLPQAQLAEPGIGAVVEFAVTARGQPSDGIAPLMALVVEGREIGRVDVDGSTRRYIFQVALDELPPADEVEVDVRYLNDAGPGPSREDRNLFVESLSVNGNEIPAHGDGVRYFRVAGDSREEIPGRVSMFWGGALIFPVPKEYLAPEDGSSGTMIAGELPAR